MKKNVYSILDKITDQYVPDNFDTIMNKITNMSPSQAPAIYPFSKKTFVKPRKYIAVAACFCAVTAAATLISMSIQNSTQGVGILGEYTNSSYFHQTAETNTVFWNEGAPLSDTRLAGHFQSVPEKDWKSYFSVDIPNKEKIDYFLVYEINKENKITDNVMFGYLSVDLGDNMSYSIYVSEGPLELSPVFVNDTVFKESQVKNKQVFLGTENNENCWAAFEQGDYNYIAAMNGLTREKSIQLVEEFLK